MISVELHSEMETVIQLPHLIGSGEEQSPEKTVSSLASCNRDDRFRGKFGVSPTLSRNCDESKNSLSQDARR